jgi:flagellar motility protein MotE (MotC chaperone)
VSAPAAERPRLRLMPVVMAAAAALLALKAVGLSSHASDLLAPPAAAAGAGEGAEAKTSEAKTAGSEAAGPEAAPKEAESGKAEPKSARPAEKPPIDRAGELDQAEPSKRALLEALGERREAIDARAAELATREVLLKAAEKRLEDRLAELKRLEQALAEADKRRSAEEDAKVKELVALYEGMKPKEAARIFEKLDARVLLDVASRMKPRQLSAVMGLMSPDAAQKLTVLLARREVAPPVAEAMAATDLPKIEGRPTPR